MEFHFATPELEAAANSASQLDALFGADADRARQRLCELAAAEHLADAASLPTLRIARSVRPAGYKVSVSDFHVPVSDSRYIVFEPVIGASKGRAAAKTVGHEAITSIKILSLG